MTSVFASASDDDPAGNTIYQQTAVGQPTPWAWDFLLWDAAGAAAVGVELQQTSDVAGDIIQGDAVIGSFSIEAPEGAAGQTLTGGPSVGIDSPVSGLEVGRLTAAFTAGDTPGTYVTTLQLDGGNSVQMHVEVAA